MTSPRRVSQKSISKSGMETRSGFKKRSNSKPSLMGSRSVMVSTHATSEPAPDPRPGPTAMSCSFAHLMKSATIKKYPEKPIEQMTSASNVSRSKYTWRVASSVMPAVSRRANSPKRASSRNCASSAVRSPARLGRIGFRYGASAAQRWAITSVLARASGTSANKAPICLPVLIHVSRLLRRRSWLSTYSPSEMHSIASCASKKSGSAKNAGFVATNGISRA